MRVSAGARARSWVLLIAALVAPAAISAADPPAPLVVAIQFEGAEYFREQTLRRMIEVREGKPLDAAQLQADARAISRSYRERGFLRAEVEPRQLSTAGQITVVFRIRAGERVKVRRLLVQGNHALTDREATAGLFTKPDELFGVFKQAGVFHAKRLDQDLQAVARNYYRRGYLEAKVTRWRARATPSADAIDVSIDVIEGPLYRVGGLALGGDLPAAEEPMRAALGVTPGDVADLVGIGEGVERVLDLWREQGYPFPRAVQSPRLDQQQHLFYSSIELQKGSPAKVGELKLRGEPWTARRVIVRDLELQPGAPYDLGALRRSRERLLQSGLFTEAKLVPVTTADPGVVDIEIEVTERPGLVKDCIFNIAPAYFQSEGLIGVGLLICPNFMGQGQRVSFIGQLSSLRQLFDVSWVEPRLLDSRFSLSTGVHRRTLVYPLFSTNTLGAELGLARELFTGARASVGYELESLDVEPIAPLAPFARTLRFPQANLRSALRARISHDTRARGLQPGAGVYHALSIATGGFWTLGDVSFIELRGTARYYVPLPLEALLKLNLQAATVMDPTGRPVVVSERYFLGGFGSVRGFRPRSLGPAQRFGDPSDPSAPAVALSLGGVHELVANIELEAPLIKEWGLKGFAFLDAGNAFDETEDFLLWGAWETAREVPLPLGLYSSIGIGLLLPTGTLPIRLEWSMPLTRRPGDPQIDFFFGVGGMF